MIENNVIFKLEDNNLTNLYFLMFPQDDKYHQVIWFIFLLDFNTFLNVTINVVFNNYFFLPHLINKTFREKLNYSLNRKATCQAKTIV